ncbi:MAG TPA: YihY/virulence factor BrkB family protein [Polyangiaceae bacterium]
MSGFSRDRGEILAAALAFYTLLSIAPLIIIAVAIAGAVLGEGAARAEITRALVETMGRQAAETVNAWVDQARASGKLASAVGFLLLTFGASRVTSQLRNALNQIWNVDEETGRGFRADVRSYLFRRLFAFAMVIASGPLLLAVFASRAAIESLGEWLSLSLPTVQPIILVMQPLLSLSVVAGLTAVVFKLVPDTQIGWRPAWVGATLTSALFNGGNYLVALYIGRAGVTQTYGAAASVVVLLLWVYFSAQLFLLGAEFTQAYSESRRAMQSPRIQEIPIRQQPRRSKDTRLEPRPGRVRPPARWTRKVRTGAVLAVGAAALLAIACSRPRPEGEEL